MIAIDLDGLAQLACNDRINAADFIADLPAYFKQIAVVLIRHDHALPS